MKRTIYTYKGRGASKQFMDAAAYSFAAAVPWLKQEFIDAAEIKKGGFRKDAAVINIPGGIGSRFYRDDLGPEGMNQIRDYVWNGGVYMGWCAGGALGMPRTEFSVGTPEEQIRDDGLNFCAGRAVGPEHAGYNSFSMTGACASPIEWERGQLSSFFNGGCAFVDLDNTTTILAKYKQSGRAAAIETKYGAGLAFMSGPHVEFPVSLLNKSDHYIAPFYDELAAHEAERLRFFYHLTRHANL